MFKFALKNRFSLFDILRVIKFRAEDMMNNPFKFRTFGTTTFCGAQGEGKTLSAVQYVRKICEEYPHCILVSNVAIKDYPFNAYLKFEKDNTYNIRLIASDQIINTEWILEHASDEDFQHICIEYTGLDMLKYVCNGEYGVLFLIDEIHLELNSLESKNIDIEVMVEISQQRKQRKHIVGTSQVYLRMAKPLREQIHDIVICSCWFNCIQYNRWLKGDTIVEENGKVSGDVKGRFLWTHKPEYYEQYDTYAKMKRYNKEWNGRKRVDNFYLNSEVLKDVEFKR